MKTKYLITLTILISFHTVQAQMKMETAWVVSGNGKKVFTRVFRPDREGKFPAVVACPGGLGVLSFDHTLRASKLVEIGLVAVDFSPQGRGRSEGTEDVNGPIHQGDLKAVIDFVKKLPYVNPENVGVLTRSFGITIGTGALARYPELKVKYLLDIEGPSGPPRDIMGGIERRESWAMKRFARNRPDVIAQDIVLYGHKLGENDFWKDRQAIHFIGKIKRPYQRIQCDIDHVQDRNKRHAMDLINAATHGASPWTRMNDNPPNIIYDYKEGSKYHWFPGIWKERRGTCDAIRKLLKELVDR